jgi:hypothetical protein
MCGTHRVFSMRLGAPAYKPLGISLVRHRMGHNILGRASMIDVGVSSGSLLAILGHGAGIGSVSLGSCWLCRSMRWLRVFGTVPSRRCDLRSSGYLMAHAVRAFQGARIPVRLDWGIAWSSRFACCCVPMLPVGASPPMTLVPVR